MHRVGVMWNFLASNLISLCHAIRCAVIHKGMSYQRNTTNFFFVKFCSVDDLLVYTKSNGT